LEDQFSRIWGGKTTCHGNAGCTHQKIACIAVLPEVQESNASHSSPGLGENAIVLFAA